MTDSDRGSATYVNGGEILGQRGGVKAGHWGVGGENFSRIYVGVFSPVCGSTISFADRSSAPTPVCLRRRVDWAGPKLSPFIDRIWTWWVRRSRSAPVRRSAPNTEVHSSKGRFDVTMVEPRS